MKDPFNPTTGEFALNNIRSLIGVDDTELEHSLKEFGWVEHLPAFKDENGVIIVGHRRLAIAARLGIEPVVKILQFGRGDQADAERLKLAIASNLGHKPLTKDDRRRLAQYLYEQGWTMQRIASALSVTHKTISKDLEGFVPQVQTPRPEGGRPKSSPKSAPKERSPETIAKEEEVAELADQGLDNRAIADQLGMSIRTVQARLEHITIKREAQAEPIITRADLSLTAQHKLDLAIKQHQRQLDIRFEQRVLDEIKHRVDEIVLPEWKKQIAEAKSLYTYRKGIMSKETFNMIRRGLHPDSRHSISDKRLEEAFNAFMKLEKLLLDEKDSPTPLGDIPSSLADWDKMKAARKAQKATKTTVARR
jgi:DNA-binding NarL/FixJ family response regulator